MFYIESAANLEYFIPEKCTGNQPHRSNDGIDQVDIKDFMNLIVTLINGTFQLHNNDVVQL